MQACKNGFDFFDQNALISVSEVDKNLLPLSMVTLILDQQNAELAKRLFSKHVQHILELNGDLKEAEFVQITHQWYKACDERGIHPEERIDRWINMSNFLVKDVNFSDYPCLTTNIKGIPIITYEGILQGISTRILLFSLSTSGTYNNRAISTLGIENFFSSLSKADFTITGCPKSMQIHKIIPVMMQYNTHKHNPDKIFKMDQRRGTPYLSSNLEQNMLWKKMHCLDCNSNCTILMLFKKKNVKYLNAVP